MGGFELEKRNILMPFHG